MLVLDSDVLTIIQRAASPEYERLRARLASSNDDVAVTIVTFEEQMRGWLAYIARQRSFAQQADGYKRLHALIDDFSMRRILDFDDAAALEADRLRKLKIRIGTMDLKIAAIVIATQSTLVTRNVADFRRIPELQLEDWHTSW